MLFFLSNHVPTHLIASKNIILSTIIIDYNYNNSTQVKGANFVNFFWRVLSTVIIKPGLLLDNGKERELFVRKNEDLRKKFISTSVL